MNLSTLGFQSKIKIGIAIIVDPDEKALYEPYHQDRHCLLRYLFWSVWLKGLTLSMLGKQSEDDILIFFFLLLLFFAENRLYNFMQIVSLRDTLHEISKPDFWRKIKNAIIKLL